MTMALAQRFDSVAASDVHADLIMMWQRLKEGWEPPEILSETDYQDLKTTKTSSALRGFAGFACSFGGGWFNTYARGDGRNFCDESRRGLLRDIQLMKNVTFSQASYFDLIFQPGDLVYCDPPYVGTTGYSVQFSNYKFWFHVRKWVAAGACVYVSEYRAPIDFERVWSVNVTSNMRRNKGTEALYVMKRTNQCMR